MNTREIIGLLLIIVGVVIVPFCWIITHNLFLRSLAGVLLFIGPILFYAERVARKENEQLKALGIIRESNYTSGDVNNSTGAETFGSYDTGYDAGGGGGFDG